MNFTLSRLPFGPWYWAIFIRPSGGWVRFELMGKKAVRETILYLYVKQ